MRNRWREASDHALIMNGNLVIAVLFGSLVLVACGGDDDPMLGVATSSLVAECEGVVVCGIVGQSETPAVSVLTRFGTSCMVGRLELRADGTVATDGRSTTWTSSPDRIMICTDDGCIRCEASGSSSRAASASTAKRNKCVGTPTSCDGRDVSECARQEGCSLDYRYSYASRGPETMCVGDAERCDSYTDESGCERQDGCYWTE